MKVKFVLMIMIHPLYAGDYWYGTKLPLTSSSHEQPKSIQNMLVHIIGVAAQHLTSAPKGSIRRLMDLHRINV